MASLMQSDPIEEDQDDPITLVEIECVKGSLSVSPFPVDSRFEEGSETSQDLISINNSTHDAKKTLILEECLQMTVKAVRCDQHLWYHRKSLTLLDPKVSPAMKMYLDETEGINDESSLGQSNVQIIGGTRLQSDANKVSDPSAHPVLSSLLNKKVRPANVGNFIVSDNSVLKKRPIKPGCNAPLHPLKLKIKEILTIKDMSPKRRSQINFKKNKGLIGLKIVRQNINVVKEEDESLLSKKQQNLVMNSYVPRTKPGPKCIQRKQSNKDFPKPVLQSTENGGQKVNNNVKQALMQHIKRKNTPHNDPEHKLVANRKERKDLTAKAVDKNIAIDAVSAQNKMVQGHTISKTSATNETLRTRTILNDNVKNVTLPKISNENSTIQTLPTSNNDVRNESPRTMPNVAVRNETPLTMPNVAVRNETPHEMLNVAIRNETPRTMPNVDVGNETQQLITGIKTEKIKEEIPDNANELPVTYPLLPTAQEPAPNTTQAAPVKSTEMNVTRVYSGNNGSTANFEDARIRPTFNQEQPNRPTINQNQHRYNNALLPTPSYSNALLPPTSYYNALLPTPSRNNALLQTPNPTFQHPRHAQRNWQQQQNMISQYQLQVQQYQAANMEWNNYQSGVNVSVPQCNQGHVDNVPHQYNVNQMTTPMSQGNVAQTHQLPYYQSPQSVMVPVSQNNESIPFPLQTSQNQMMTPHTNQVMMTNSNPPLQYVCNPMVPLSTQGSTNISAPTQTTLSNTYYDAPSTSQGVITHTMHLKPQPPPPPYPDHLINVGPPRAYSNATSVVSHFDGNSAMPSACSQSMIATNVSNLSHGNFIHNNVAIQTPPKAAAKSKRKRPLVLLPYQNLSENTMTTWTNAPISATSTNCANQQNSNMLSNPADYQYINQVNHTQMNAYGDTNLNYTWHHPTQPPSVCSDANYMNSLNTTLNSTGEIRKVNLAGIKKKLCDKINPIILKKRNSIQVKNWNPAPSNPNFTEISLSTDIIGRENPSDNKMPKPNVTNTTAKSKAKRATVGKKSGTANSVKVRPGLCVAQNIEATPKDFYSPPILPIPSVYQSYEILLNSQPTLTPASMQIMKRSCGKTFPSTILKKILDGKKEKLKTAKDVKKISLEEYKRRAANPDNKVIDLTDDDQKTGKTNDQKSKQCGINNNASNNAGGGNKGRRSVDWQDLGYDSDSTARLI